MLGTLNGALEVRQVKLENDALRADVEGLNQVVDGIPTLREIRVRYTIRVSRDLRERVDRALASHQDKCPTARSLAAAVAVSWSAEIEEV